MMKSKTKSAPHDDGEFLWLVSLSDLMILLFVFFVVLFSFSFQKMGAGELSQALSVLKGDTRTPIDEVQANLGESLSAKGLNDAVEITQKNGTLTLQIKDSVLFDSGQFHLKEQSREVLRVIAKAIAMIPPLYHIGIEGHTDDVPIRKPGISDNWELSVKRAHTVFYALDLSDELKKRSVIMGYADTVPLHPHRNESQQPIVENQNRNRRVTLRIF